MCATTCNCKIELCICMARGGRARAPRGGGRTRRRPAPRIQSRATRTVSLLRTVVRHGQADADAARSVGAAAVRWRYCARRRQRLGAHSGRPSLTSIASPCVPISRGPASACYASRRVSPAPSLWCRTAAADRPASPKARHAREYGGQAGFVPRTIQDGSMRVGGVGRMLF
jgi:hypothetical protein